MAVSITFPPITGSCAYLTRARVLIHVLTPDTPDTARRSSAYSVAHCRRRMPAHPDSTTRCHDTIMSRAQ